MRAALICLLLSTLAACGGGGESPVEAASFQVGGTLAGLGGGKNVVIADASGPSASLSANGTYSLRLPAGTAYNLRVLTQPQGQTCSVGNGTGVANGDVNNIAVVCANDVVAPEARIVAGSVAGLGSGRSLVLQLTAEGTTQEAVVRADGTFEFPTAITGTYAVTVKAAPTGQACVVANGQGSTPQPTPVTVTCSPAAQAFKLGGTVSGNAGVVALRNAANGETVVVVGDGSFVFAQPVPQAANYAVVVADQSPGQSCHIANAAGTAYADVSGIAVTCAADVVIVTPAPALPPSVPAGLTMTYGVMSFNLAWGTVTAPAGGGPVNYRLFEDADGPGAAVATQIGGTLAAGTYTHAVPNLLHTRLNARYSVQACNTGGCSTLSAAITPNLTQAIGYFKPGNTQANDWFGYALALSADGSTLAVGALLEDSNATGIDGNAADNSAVDSGAVYVFSRAGGTWSQQAYVKASNTGAGDRFGSAVALSADGSTLAVGAPLEGSAATGTHVATPGDGVGAVNSGAVYVYTRTGSSWAQQAYVKAGNTGAHDHFGTSVALSADGSTLAAGAWLEDSNATGVGGDPSNNGASDSGAAYVFTRAGATWSQQAYLKANNTQSSAVFGRALALSADGNTLAVAAPWEDSISGGDTGAVHVFSRAGASWTHLAHVKASNAQAGDTFGWSVALSGDGATLAVGAWGEDSNATGIGGDQANNGSVDSGAVYVFARSGAAWTQEAYIKASNTGAGDHFGHGVALSGNGSTLAVGVVYEDSSGTGIGADQSNNAATDSGAVYLFSRSATVWTQQAYVKPSKAGMNEFGFSTALSGDGTMLAVGTHRDDSNATGVSGDQSNTGAIDSGAVFIY